jgi:hypothetical protein
MNLPAPHCTVAEAADHLRLSVRHVTRLLVPMGPQIGGKIRFQKLGTTRLVRCLSADVGALLPVPWEPPCNSGPRDHLAMR